MYYNKLINPILFQGKKKRKNYFEGWYYKQVSKDEKNAISIIPGISLFEDDVHSFVQYIFSNSDILGNKIINGYARYDYKDFQFNNDPFQINVSDNVFTESDININLKDEANNISGVLSYGPLTNIKRNLIMPNIMGYFAYLPFMQCYHGVISVNHSVNGFVNINGKKIDFNNGKGYIEKDWGSSFPSKYIWVQCNNFLNNNTNVICSVAEIPFMKQSFLGFICNLVIANNEYRFATYNNSKFLIDKSEEILKLIFIKNNLKLTIETSNESGKGNLIAPAKGRMQKIINEDLSGIITIKLFECEKLIYEDNGKMAGIENVGF